MNDPFILHPVAIGSAIVQSVNARDLHAFLVSKQQFADWIKARIDQYGFVDGTDYVIHKIMNNLAGGRPTQEYHLSINMAKELAMVERNEKGKQARQYFIECERRILAQTAPAIPSPANLSRLQLIELAMQAEQERIETEKARAALEVKVIELAPKAEALHRLETAEGSFCIRDAAKTLQVQEKILKKFLLEQKWVYRRPMGHEILAYSDRIQSGCMEHKITRGEKSDGSEWVSTQARVTAKGMAKLAEQLSRPEQGSLLSVGDA